MPDLSQTLQGRDLGFLKIVASLWGVDVPAPDTHTALAALPALLLEPGLVHEVIEALPKDAQAALSSLIQNEGRLPWPGFTRRFGGIREMGPGQRDRKKPYQAPSTPTEALWYRALIGRAFLDSGSGLIEYAYIPDDWIPLLPALENEPAAAPPIRPATPAERAVPDPASDEILDSACTLLAGLRMGWSPEQIPWDEGAIPKNILQTLLETAGLLDPNGVPLPDATRNFLEANRPTALAELVRAWLNSTQFNELRMTPGLVCEGEWRNDPLVARRTVLELLRQVPLSGWWSVASFTAVLRERHPEFQRPAGDFDSWFIRDTASGEYLRGIQQWDRMEGALVRFMLRGPLHWLGIVDLASVEKPSGEASDGSFADGPPPSAFRMSSWSMALLDERPPSGLPREDTPLFARSNGLIRLSNLTPRAVRYQIARFCEWQPATRAEYAYRVTPASLDRARRQGLRSSHLIALLRKHSSGPVPPPLVQALERWETSGVQARLEPVVLLRVSSPEILAALKRSQAARFLGDPLGPTTVIIQSGAQAKVLAVLTEMGYLAEGEWEPVHEKPEQNGRSIIQGKNPKSG